MVCLVNVNWNNILQSQDKMTMEINEGLQPIKQ